MALIEHFLYPDLEAERMELLELIRTTVPAQLQQTIATAIAQTQEKAQWQIVVNETGSENAKS